MEQKDKPIEWMGSTLKDLSEMPDEVKRDIGFALRFAQRGRKHDKAVPLRGFGGASVLEIVSDYDTDTYRGVYTVRFAGVVYVLHVFQKKSTQGIATSKRDIELIQSRLREARELYAARQAARKRTP